MNLNRGESFEELNPRTAPIPVSYSDAPALCTVPEVSLVFSNSPVTRKREDKKVSSPNFESNLQNSLSDGLFIREKLLDNSYKTLPIETLSKRTGRNSVEDISYTCYNPSRIQWNTDCRNEELIKQFDVDQREMVGRHLPDVKTQECINTTCFHRTVGENPQNQRKVATKMVNSKIIGNNVHVYDTQVKSLNPSNLKFSHDSMHVNSLTAHHYPENILYSNKTSERMSHNHVQSRPATAACGRQLYCCDVNGSSRSQNMMSESDLGPFVKTDVPNPKSHADYREHRQCFLPRVHYTNSCGNVKNVSSFHPNKCTNIVDVAKEHHHWNECIFENNGDIYNRKNNHLEENVIPPSNRLDIQHKENLSPKDQEHLKINLDSQETDMINVRVGSDTRDRSVCIEEFQGQEVQFNKNFDNPSENEKIQIDKGNSDTSILKEIVLMNQKQCNMLHSLLQQVVVMQADQMKILREINDKLNNTRIIENVIPSKQKNTCASSKEIPKMEDARTQTSISEGVNFCCQNCEVKNKQTIPMIMQNSSQSMQSNPTGEMNLQTKNIISQNHNEQEKDQNKSKKLQDRAVSWSAIHGIETVEESFTLHGVCVPTVVDQLPSSVHTMHLHVQDYHSSASFDSITESRPTNDVNYIENGQDNPKGSWTLYDNIVGHVKKFLQTVPGDKSGNASQKTSQVEAIRFATIEKIRQLGVNVYENSTEIKELNATGRIHFDSKLTSRSSCQDHAVAGKKSSDVSLELQTLALKYLGDDDLSNSVKWNQNGNTHSILKANQKPTNISLATQHYLEKYHLLPSDVDYKDKKLVNANSGQVCLEENILDITTLKRQPKLL